MKTYVVYILANNPLGTLYIGVTNNLKQRINEHKLELVDGFTKKYGLKKLVYVEQFRYINDALTREKQLKRWHREWKINFIEQHNPQWVDLYETIFGPEE
ncbi:MAG: GIY-YIG nuclease family protein [bacterium]